MDKGLNLPPPWFVGHEPRIKDLKNTAVKMMNQANLKSMPPFEIQFANLNEIRMGSPYNSCEIVFIGTDKIKLPETATWQDRYAWSIDFKYLALVRWDMENNIPGFHFFVIDMESGKGWESPRFLGLLNNFSIIGNNIKFNKFLFDKEKSAQGQLCCNFDDECELWY